MICIICNSLHKNFKSHLLKEHNITPKDYYVLSGNTLKVCLICNKELGFVSLNKPYKNGKLCSGCMGSLEGKILLYGDEIGTLKYLEANNKRKYSNSKEGIINKHGEEFYNEYIKRCDSSLVTLEKRKDPEYNRHFLSKQTTRIEYYTDILGLSQIEAEVALSNRQKTFSKDKCIERYGYDKGIEVFNKRQEKWQNTLNSKSEEEKIKINKKKIPNILNNSSKLEIKFIKDIESKFGIILETQYRLDSSDKSYFYDCKYLDLLIEFQGTYYHRDPRKYDSEYISRGIKTIDIWINDSNKKKNAIENGFKYISIWESDYKNNKDVELEKIGKLIYEN